MPKKKRIVVNLKPRLFFVDELCSSCPMFVFDPIKKTWSRSKTPPVPGDHVVVNMVTEKVVMVAGTNGSLVYRSLTRSSDSKLWNGSYPDKMPVTDTRVSVENSLDDFDDEAVTETPDEPLRAFRI